MKKLFISIIVSLLFVQVFAQKQSLLFEQVSMVDGLSQVNVSSIMQDTTGFMWFATQDGLNCYDGYTFKVFKPSPQNGNSISSNRISCLFQDSKGKIWVGTIGGGLNLYNPLNETFTHYIHDSKKTNSLSNDDVYDIFEDSDGDLWIATYGGGLNKFNPQTGNFTIYKHNPN